MRNSLKFKTLPAFFISLFGLYRDNGDEYGGERELPSLFTFVILAARAQDAEIKADLSE